MIKYQPRHDDDSSFILMKDNNLSWGYDTYLSALIALRNEIDLRKKAITKEINRIKKGCKEKKLIEFDEIFNHPQNPGAGTGAAVHGDRRGGGEE